MALEIKLLATGAVVRVCWLNDEFELSICHHKSQRNFTDCLFGLRVSATFLFQAFEFRKYTRALCLCIYLEIDKQACHINKLVGFQFFVIVQVFHSVSILLCPILLLCLSEF